MSFEQKYYFELVNAIEETLQKTYHLVYIDREPFWKSLKENIQDFRECSRNVLKVFDPLFVRFGVVLEYGVVKLNIIIGKENIHRVFSFDEVKDLKVLEYIALKIYTHNGGSFEGEDS